ncbi:hypothetical protein [Chryseobacterium sp. AG844]|uniref:hypothetical protein n=1 Tax=Chryseobacterium sp. AG844 TaxID=2183998 RepID=UPI000D70B1DE|nr:hypothetical protein [Chryseobacterium sp. AG844]PWW20591.1 hypothetical protein DEU40_11313 [Chryseobacterium sp. AG844]
MKKLFLMAAWVFSSAVYSQVGVNTHIPNATFDIKAKNATGSMTNIDGLLIPRVDRERAMNMSHVKTSTLIYVDNISTGTATGQASNVVSTGFYYFDETLNKWVRLLTDAKAIISELKIPVNVLYARSTYTSSKNGSNTINPLWFDVTDHINNEYISSIVNTGEFMVNKGGLYTFDVREKLTNVPEKELSVSLQVPGDTPQNLVNITTSLLKLIQKTADHVSATHGVGLGLNAGNVNIVYEGSRMRDSSCYTFIATTIKLNAGDKFSLKTIMAKSGTYREGGGHISVMYTPIP